MTITDEDLAKIAYQGYGESVGFKNYQGLPMPEWDNLGNKIQSAWVAAIEAVIDQLAENADEGVISTGDGQ